MEKEAKDMVRAIATGIKHIHDIGLCHRDIKLTNIIISPPAGIKIVDFGFAVENKDYLSLFCGTPSYMAPEIIQRKEYNGQKVDIWALGVVLCKIVTGEYPFGGISKISNYSR